MDRRRRPADPVDAIGPARDRSKPLRALLVTGVLLTLATCTARIPAMTQAELTDFATRYAAAWSSQDPARLASFYAEDGSLSVNAGAPAVGRAAIAETARSFMAGFPDMLVRLDSVSREGDRVVFRWIWTGTNTGPGGTGAAVHMTGREEWTIGADGLIAVSEGHYDDAEYQRQLQAGAPQTGE
ncbi:MAG: nuclear transport factor 2 family protein [Gemmatimonadales bacterium]